MNCKFLPQCATNLNAKFWDKIDQSQVLERKCLAWLKDVPRTTGTLLTIVILLMGVLITILRFGFGLGAVTNLSDDYPWGLWIAFDLLCGVALAAGGYITSASCYLFGIKRYHAAVRPAITTAFLGYAFVVFALSYDVGQPWRLHYPLLVSPGTSSVLFEVGLCVATYLTVLFLEWSLAPLEWLSGKNVLPSWTPKWFNPTRLRSIRNFIGGLTIPLTIFGVILSTLHQSSLGSLFLIAPNKMHPLWYSSFLPVFFFVSSWVAGLSMVIAEGSLAHKYYHHKMDQAHLNSADHIVFGFGRAASLILFAYFIIRIMDMALNSTWNYLFTGYGIWYLIEMFGFIALPCLLFAMGVREKRLCMIRSAAWIAIIGIIFNRYTICLVAFNWQLPQYVPSLMEICFSIFVITCVITAYRFIATKMPVLFEHPNYKD